jgi:hypothetical protein
MTGGPLGVAGGDAIAGEVVEGGAVTVVSGADGGRAWTPEGGELGCVAARATTGWFRDGP